MTAVDAEKPVRLSVAGLTQGDVLNGITVQVFRDAPGPVPGEYPPLIGGTLGTCPQVGGYLDKVYSVSIAPGILILISDRCIDKKQAANA